MVFSDILTCMMMLDVQVELYQRGRISLEEFAKLPYDRDILVQVILKKDGRRAAYASSRRSKTDFPIIACGVAKKGDSWYVSVGARPARAALCVLPAGNAAVKDLAEKAAEAFFLRGQYESWRRIQKTSGAGFYPASDGSDIQGGRKIKCGVIWKYSLFLNGKDADSSDCGGHPAFGSAEKSGMLQCETGLRNL